MSTTAHLEVATDYASTSKASGVVFRIQQGTVNRGADISWFSQYPHEQEILFAPLSSLEVMHLCLALQLSRRVPSPSVSSMTAAR